MADGVDTERKWDRKPTANGAVMSAKAKAVEMAMAQAEQAAVADDGAPHFTENDERLLEEFCKQIATAVESTQRLTKSALDTQSMLALLV